MRLWHKDFKYIYVGNRSAWGGPFLRRDPPLVIRLGVPRKGAPFSVSISFAVNFSAAAAATPPPPRQQRKSPPPWIFSRPRPPRPPQLPRPRKTNDFHRPAAAAAAAAAGISVAVRRRGFFRGRGRRGRGPSPPNQEAPPRALRGAEVSSGKPEITWNQCGKSGNAQRPQDIQGVSGSSRNTQKHPAHPQSHQEPPASSPEHQEAPKTASEHQRRSYPWELNDA